MSAAVAGGREAAVRTMGFFRNHSIRFVVRSLSSVSAPETTTAKTGLGSASKPKKRKKKNLFEVAQFLPNWGIGYQMAKNHWNGTSYKITKINLYKDGRHGKAWGVFHKDGVPSAEEKKISGVHKRGWRYYKFEKDRVTRSVTGIFTGYTGYLREVGKIMIPDDVGTTLNCTL